MDVSQWIEDCIRIRDNSNNVKQEGRMRDGAKIATRSPKEPLSGAEAQRDVSILHCSLAE